MADVKSIMAELEQPLWHNWYIKEEIGAGASSIVCKIEADRGDRVDVSALKIEPITIDDVLHQDPQKKASLLEKKRQAAVNETGIMYKLRKSKYIVGYEDEDIRKLKNNEGYVLLIRMEYLECLHNQVRTGKFNRSESNVLKLAHDIASGIKVAHEIGVIHRDIKPANFFYSPEDKIYKLGDFNISRTTASARSFAGTEGYIAPEIYKAKQSTENVYTKQADIYSFGICLYQLMNNLCFPFEDNCLAEEAIDRRMSGQPLPPPQNASPEFSRIILKACAYNINDRYASIDEMLNDINILRGDNPPTLNPVYAAPTINPFSQDTANESAFTDGISQHQKPKKKKSKAILIVAVVFVLAASVAAAVIVPSVLKKKKEAEQKNNPEYIAEIFAESFLDADGFDTYTKLELLDDTYEAYKGTDEYNDEKEDHENMMKELENEGIEFSVDNIKELSELSDIQLDGAEYYLETMADYFDVSADIKVTEGYEYKIIYTADGETDTDGIVICVVKTDSDGWKVIDSTAEYLESFSE